MSSGSSGHQPEAETPPADLQVEVWMQIPSAGQEPGPRGGLELSVQWPLRAAWMVGRRARRGRKCILGGLLGLFCAWGFVGMEKRI
jgi:hypothetical protein